MHPYNTTPKCPRCGKSVYAAEQVMGPGRRLYHKPCLACTSCNKRLDSYTLLEHDQEPYCKQCHAKCFGPRDLRQANLPHRDEALIPPERTVFTSTSPLKPHLTGLGPSTPSPSPSPSTSPPPTVSQQEEELTVEEKEEERDTVPSSPSRNAFSSATDLTTPTHTGRGRFGLPRTVPLNLNLTPSRIGLNPTHTANLSPTRTGQSIHTHRPTQSLDSTSSYASSAATLGRSNSDATSRPALPRPLMQTATGTRYGALLTGVPMSPTKRWGMTTNPVCPRCEKSVYFAEQVKAVGKTYHKGCLRCVQCGTSLDSSKLTEREGQPYCNRCYSKTHGPAGSGYALLGKAGG